MTTLEEDWGTVSVLPQPSLRGVPWEDPELSGWVGFYRTLRDLLLHPEEFFKNLGPGGWAKPLAFALIVSTAGLSCAFFWEFLMLAGTASTSAGSALSPSLGPAMLLGLMVASPLLVLFHLGVGGICWWGSVALSGAGREFIPTWRIFCYAHGGMALAAIPFLGMLLSFIWVLALLFIGTKNMFGLAALNPVGTLAIFLIIMAVLGLTLLLGLIIGLTGLGFLALLG